MYCVEIDTYSVIPVNHVHKINTHVPYNPQQLSTLYTHPDNQINMQMQVLIYLLMLYATWYVVWEIISQLFILSVEYYP